MRKWCVGVIAAASVGIGSVQAGAPLADHQWRHRVLLLYVPDADAPELASFRDAVRGRQCGMDDRDLVIGEVIGDDAGALGGRSLEAGSVRALRGAHGIGRERAVTVLVGKDSGVKMEVDGVADIDRVFRRIDGMPMRKQEMAERGGDPCD